jgi:hypothetical protein
MLKLLIHLWRHIHRGHHLVLVILIDWPIKLVILQDFGVHLGYRLVWDWWFVWSYWGLGTFEDWRAESDIQFPCLAHSRSLSGTKILRGELSPSGSDGAWEWALQIWKAAAIGSIELLLLVILTFSSFLFQGLIKFVDLGVRIFQGMLDSNPPLGLYRGSNGARKIFVWVDRLLGGIRSLPGFQSVLNSHSYLYLCSLGLVLWEFQNWFWDLLWTLHYQLRLGLIDTKRIWANGSDV